MSCKEFLHLFRIFNTLMGLPLFVRSAAHVFTAYQFFSEIIIAIGVLGQLWAVPVISHDMNILCACLASATHSMQVLLKTWMLRAMRIQFEKHLVSIDKLLLKHAQLERFINLHTPVPSFANVHYQEGRYARVILITFFLLTVASTSSYFLPIDLQSIISSDDLSVQLAPIVVHFHWDMMFTPAFQCLNIFLTVCFYLVNLKTIVLDSFILGLIVHHTVHFRHLKMLLDASIELNDLADLSSIRTSQGKSLIKMCLMQHQALLKSTYHLVKILSPYLLLEFAYVFIHTCVPAFVITSTLSWTLAQKSAVFFIMGAGLCQLFFLSRAGDYLTKAVEDTGNALYRYNVLLYNNKWQRIIYNMTSMRAHLPLKLSAATVFPLSGSTFITISRLILSYYMTLNEVQRMKGGK